MKLKTKVAAVAAAAVASLSVFAGTASAVWVGFQIPRNGHFYATDGVYFDTPEMESLAQYGGPCSNFRVQLRRAQGGSLVADSANSVYACPFGSLLQWIYPARYPDYPGGVRIWVVAGPGDGQLVSGYVEGLSH